MGWSILARIAGAGILYLACKVGKALHKWGMLPTILTDNGQNDGAMMTEDLKRSQESYLQKVLDIAREIPAQRGASLQKQYYALKDITNGLRVAIQGLIDLQRLYAPTR